MSSLVFSIHKCSIYLLCEIHNKLNIVIYCIRKMTDSFINEHSLFPKVLHND